MEKIEKCLGRMKLRLYYITQKIRDVPETYNISEDPTCYGLFLVIIVLILH